VIKILASALAVVIFPAIAFSQTTDVDGWNGTRWGMSLAQIQAVITYPLERDPHFVSARAPVVYRTVEPFKMLDTPVRAYFLFSPDDNQLVGVEVQIDSHFLESIHSPSERFERFRRSLVEKYGRPTFTDDRGRIVFWRFASSSVTLTWAEVGREPFVGVAYKQANK
jgi:hypothetical protein